ELFLASTSQRALVMLLGSYEPNTEAYAWQLSSGSLGPGLSWDTRIRALPPASRLSFDASTWRSAIARSPPKFEPAGGDPTPRIRDLAAAIDATFAELELDLTQWLLPLSGGYDSRMILLLLKDRPGLRTLTWGRRAALHDPNNDAYIARAL